MGHRAKVELVLDCAEPIRLATFWRDALDYRDYLRGCDLGCTGSQGRDRFTASPSGRT